MTSHWPTFADGLIWCACDNRTFDSEEAWQAHVVMVESAGIIRATTEYVQTIINAARDYLDWADPLPPDGVDKAIVLIRALDAYKPSETADELPHRGA